VGCRTTQARQARGRAIEVYEVLADGRWRHAHSAPAGDNPSYLVLGPGGRHLHAVHGDGSTVSSFAITAQGGLQLLGTQSTAGDNPVHLCSSPCGQWMAVANYASGSVALAPVLADGHLGSVADLLQLPHSPGPRSGQQRGAHPHQVVFDPSGRWLLVPDKGCDAIHTLRLDASGGRLHAVASLAAAPGSGPRHMVFAPDGRHAWAVLELSCQVLALRFDRHSGQLQPLQTLSSLPDGLAEAGTGAGIVLDPSGQALYVSNRGHGSVCEFAVDLHAGALRARRWLAAGGQVPRFICAVPGAHALLIANEDAHTVVQAEWGAEPPSISTLAHTGSPVCAVFTQATQEASP
jgi:6-phosphogluconolactonase (cycloisomerase 2 family)